MYIRNIQKIPRKFICGSLLAHYLMSHDVPLLSQEKTRFFFAETDLLRQQLQTLPWPLCYLKHTWG
jgi:hypothetical protein